ncbi:MAG: phosphoribosylglycinamide formyltransferase [Phycisphaerales bacterium]|nr:phosphoribosylglycinamide formyltransferase [Phycisphaerales bacterium]
MIERRLQLSPTEPSVGGPHPNPVPAIPGQGTDRITLAVLVSGGGTTLQNLIDRIATGELNARIGVVIASKPGIYGIDRATTAGLPIITVVRKEFPSAEAFSERIFAECEAAGADLVVLAGWLQLLQVPAKWDGRVMNIHPALLPKYGGRGMFGRHVHAAVLAAGETVSGCTVHFVNNEYDAGAMILQKTCVVDATETPEQLAHRVFECECAAYPEAIAAYAQGRVRLVGGRTVWR